MRDALLEHFAPLAPEALVAAKRTFPMRLRVDLQRALDAMFPLGDGGCPFFGFHVRYSYGTASFASLLQEQESAAIAPARYADVDIGEAAPARCLESGVWLFAAGDVRYALLLSQQREFDEHRAVSLELLTPAGAVGERIARERLDAIAAAAFGAATYRGKILSLEIDERMGGVPTGISVHRMSSVGRDEVILPTITLALLERNVLRFVAQRQRLRHLGLSVKKGLLFYGPPGTGKTHTIRYLAGALRGMTTLLITAEQQGLLQEYMALARLLQPSMVVLEDVDLIGRSRESMDGPCAESLLNRLLNEMDGLKEDCDVLFVLTTNRPEALEAALTGRPGRIDQAIEFPLPDEAGRAKLVRLYARGASMADDLVGLTARRTDGVSAAFIKELMRRAAQSLIEAGAAALRAEDIEHALDEMLFDGGSLNLKLLGAERWSRAGFVAESDGSVPVRTAHTRP